MCSFSNNTNSRENNFERNEYEESYACKTCGSYFPESKMLKCTHCSKIIMGVCTKLRCKVNCECIAFVGNTRVPFCYEYCRDNYLKEKDIERHNQLVEKDIKRVNEYYDLIIKYKKINKIIEKISSSEVNLLEDEYKLKELEYSTVCRQRLIALLSMKFDSLVDNKPKVTAK